MPPVNINFATATLIPALPYDFTQMDINDGGVNFDVYYKFVAPAGARVIGAWGSSGKIGVGQYRPDIEPYDAAFVHYMWITGHHVPIQFPVTPGDTYYLVFYKNVDTPGPEQLRVKVEVHAQAAAIPYGTILINDDTDGFPLACLSATVDRTVLGFVKGFAAGEAGCVLRSGVMAFEHYATHHIKTYSSNFGLINDLHHGSVMRIRACRKANKFYVGSHTNPVVVQTVTPAGAFGPTSWTLAGNTSIHGIAAANDESILYFANLSTGAPIKRWNLVTGAAMADFAVGIAGYYIVDIFVLADDTILVLFYQPVLADVIVRRYNAAGAILNTYPIGFSQPEAGTFARAAYAVDDPNSFWVFVHPDTGKSRFLNVKVSDGSILTTRDFDEFEGGAWEQAETLNPTSRFGNSFSCPIVIYHGTYAGIHYIHPDKPERHDSYYQSVEKKIPNPIFRTAYVGE